MITEKNGFSINGYLAFFVVLPFLQVSFGMMLANNILFPVSIICSIIVFICWAGFFMVQPNQAKISHLAYSP